MSTEKMFAESINELARKQLAGPNPDQTDKGDYLRDGVGEIEGEEKKACLFYFILFPTIKGKNV